MTELASMTDDRSAAWIVAAIRDFVDRDVLSSRWSRRCAKMGLSA